MKNPHVLVTWPVFIELYCIFEGGKVNTNSLIKFWTKFFDPNSIGTCRKKDYMKLLEELVRGNALDKPTKATLLFAKMF